MDPKSSTGSALLDAFLYLFDLFSEVAPSILSNLVMCRRPAECR